MSRVPAESQKAFFLVIGALAALYVGSLIVRRLPASLPSSI
jgi:hypothetical protein